MQACAHPKADFLPIACPPIPDAPGFGERLGKILNDRSVAVVASTDLTHYGADYRFAPAEASVGGVLNYVRENDQRIIDLAARLDGSAIVPEALSNANACGSGALAAAVAAAASRGAQEGILVEYSTSADAYPTPSPDRVVGYAGMIFT